VLQAAASVKGDLRLPSLVDAVLADGETDAVGDVGTCVVAATPDSVADVPVAAASSADLVETADSTDEATESAEDEAADDEAGGRDDDEVADDAADEDEAVDDAPVVSFPSLLCTNCTTVSVVLLLQYER